MTRYIIKRFFQSFLTIVIVVTAVFLLLRLMPTSGYFTRDDYINMTEEMRNAYLRNLGLMDPPLVQLKNFFGDVLQGDLGRSITVYPKLPITTILADKIPYSLYFVIDEAQNTVRILSCFHNKRNPNKRPKG